MPNLGEGRPVSTPGGTVSSGRQMASAPRYSHPWAWIYFTPRAGVPSLPYGFMALIVPALGPAGDSVLSLSEHFLTQRERRLC